MIWINNVKVLAIFTVITLHIASGVVRELELASSFEWWTANIITSLTRWCVPVFVMLSGALLLESSKTEPLKEFYKKRASKILVPLIFWTLFFLLWRCSAIILNGGEISLSRIIKMLVFGKPYYHMWFIYMITCLYLMTPFFRKIFAQSSNRELWFITSILFIFSIASNAHTIFFGENKLLFIEKFLLYVPYFFIGHMICRYNYSAYRIFIYSVFVISVVITSLGYYYFAANAQRDFGLYFYGYLSVSVVPMSIAIFILMKDSRIIQKHHDKITPIAVNTLGIYLIHPLFIELLGFFDIFAIQHNPIFSIPVTSVLVFGLALFSVRRLVNLPYLKHIV